MADDKKRSAASIDEIVIEINAEAKSKFQDLWFEPAQRKLRGKYFFPRGTQCSNNMSKMPDIPGMLVKVSGKTMKGSIVDPLEGNTLLLEEINSIQKTFPGGNQFRAVQKEEVHFRNNDELATWLFWILRAVETKTAVLIKGTLLTKAEIIELGQARIGSSQHEPEDLRHLTPANMAVA